MRRVRNGFTKSLPYLCLIGVIALGLMTIVGSNGGGGGGTAATTTTTTLAPATGELKIVNNTSKTFTTVYLSPTTATTWGSDQCTHTISPGETWTLTLVTPNDYDLRVVFTDGAAYELRGFSIVAGQTYTLTLTDSNILGTLKIVNNTSKTFTIVYLSLTTSGTWGNDQCTHVVGPGDTWTLINIPPDDYDLMVVFTDASTYTKWNFEITGGRTYTLTLS